MDKTENNENTSINYSPETVNVQVTMGDIKVQFNGTAESVMSSLVTFLGKQVPALDMARKLYLNYSASEMVEMFSNYIKITPEGPRVLMSNDSESESKRKLQLSDKEVVSLQLVACRIARDLGKASDDSIQLNDIVNCTSINPKSVSSRLSELVKAGCVARNESDSQKYHITTVGINWLNSTLARKTKSG